MSDLAAIGAQLERWPEPTVEMWEWESSVGARVHDALQGLPASGERAAGPLDLAGLISHLLRRESLLREDPSLRLRVPRASGWPTAEMWRKCGCAVVLSGTDHFRLEARTWHPNWLTYTGLADPLAPAVREEQRRLFREVPADPALRETLGYTHYLGVGQRAAVRSAMLLPPGGSLLTVLPTGGGKSLSVFAPARLYAESGGVTVVVVPTVALAIDQARRAATLLKGTAGADQVDRWAYHGGLSREEKAAIRKRLKDGTQPVVFAAPEAITLSLRPALLELARAGRLAAFVVDEAHLISQWGDEFRPDFQVLAGIRHSLLGACPPEAQFRTILLTATLTEEAWWTLRTLFGGDDLEVCASVNLRPEPDYFLARADSEEQREAWVTELIHALPRPFILYTTTRKHAEEWHQRLSGLGLKRVGLMHGGTPTERREDLLQEWNARSLDIMVATSAFGLGMDQSDVRAVVHACIPETVDRFYQEVGRGGRDGKACLSFLLAAPGDLRVAKQLNEDRIVGINKGLARWEAMYRSRRSCEDGDSVLVRLDARHAGVKRDSDSNVSWNVRTLVLMARAGLLTLEAHTPPVIERLGGETDQAFEVRLRAAFAEHTLLARVRPANLPHLSRETWEHHVAVSRKASRAADKQAHARVRELLSAKRPYAELFGETYTVAGAHITPARGIGSCPVSRRRGEVRRSAEGPWPEPMCKPMVNIGRALAGLMSSRKRLLIACPNAESGTRRRREVLRLLQRLVTLGVREVAAAQEWLDRREYRQLFRHAQPPLVLHHPLEEDPGPLQDGLAVPRASLLWPRCSPNQLDHALELDRPAHLIFLPSDLPDPRHPARDFFDTRDHLSLTDLSRSLDSWGS